MFQEQQKRNGVHEATMPSDPGKPLPEDVMKLLSVGLDFEKKFIELCSEAETSLFCTFSAKELRFVYYMIENSLKFSHDVKHNKH